MTKLLVVTLVLISGLSSIAFGGVISKTFEIGEGTSNARSNKRTFEVPCNLAVSALVTYSRLGRPGTENDVPLTLTVMAPAADGGEGEVVKTRQVTANTNSNSITLLGGSSLFGCSKTWAVRVKAADESSGFTVKGEIRVTFVDFQRPLAFTYGNSGQSIANGQTEDVNVYFAEGAPDYAARIANSQGVIEIKGKWYHNLATMPIRMRAELVNPRGEVVASDSGYPQNEINPCCSTNKLKLIYRITEYIEGVWKVRLKNLSDHDAVDASPIGTFKPSCP